MGKKKDKIPPPGNKKDPYTNFMKKAKWVSVLRSSMLDIQGNPIQKEGAVIVANVLLKNVFVERLNLTQTHLGDGGITEFAQMLKVNNTIRHLSVGVNDVTEVGGVMFASAFLVNRTVNFIYAPGNNFGDDTAAAFAFVLKSNFEIRELDLSWNAIGESGAQALAQTLKQNSGVILHLGQNRIGDLGARAMCGVLKEVGTKELNSVINLWQNDIGSAGGIAVAELVEQNDRLQLLNMSWNSLGNSVAAIAKAVAVNQGKGVFVPKTEEEIKKEIAALVEDGWKKQEEMKYVKAQELKVVMKQYWVQEKAYPACTITTLMLSQNLVGDVVCDEVAKLIMANGYLRSIDLSWNVITSEGCIKLMEALHTGTALESLNLAHNKITETAAQAVANLISTTSSLTALYLQRNEIKDAGKNVISAAIPRTSKIRVNYGALDDMIPLTGAFMSPVHAQPLPSSRNQSRGRSANRKFSNSSAMSWGTEGARGETTSRGDAARGGRKSQSRGSTASVLMETMP